MNVHSYYYSSYMISDQNATSASCRTCRQVWKERLEREQKELASLTGDDRKRAEKLSKDKRVHPVDAPKGSLRARLLKQMTATESSSKTAVSDLLFNLCADEGTPEFFVSVRGDALRCVFMYLTNAAVVSGYCLRNGIFPPMLPCPPRFCLGSAFDATPNCFVLPLVPFRLKTSADEFTTRCGFGNAVNTLRLKGRISVPGVV